MTKSSLPHFALATLLTVGPVVAAETKSPITHETLWLLKQVGAPAPSPDGRWVVVPVKESACKENDEVTDLWLVYLPQGGEVTVDLAPASGKLVVEWFNPDTGDILPTASTSGGPDARSWPCSPVIRCFICANRQGCEHHDTGMIFQLR